MPAGYTLRSFPVYVIVGGVVIDVILAKLVEELFCFGIFVVVVMLVWMLVIVGMFVLGFIYYYDGLVVLFKC